MLYFDNLNVVLNRGRIIEENHYYAYGLKIRALSSQKLPDPNEGNIDNKNLYNDKELFDDADLDWYDYGFRNYDAQIGRFTQLDPLTWDYPELTNYQYASCEPIANIDIDGLEAGISTAGTFYAGTQTLAEVVVKSTPHVAQTAGNTGTLLNASTRIALNAPNIIRSSIPSGPKPPLNIKPKASPSWPPLGQAYLSSSPERYQWQKDANTGKQIKERLKLGLDPESGRKRFDFSNLDKANDNLVEPLVTGLALEVGLGAVSGLVSPVLRATKTSSNLWKVGSYSELRGLEVGLDAHHVGQKALMNRFVPGYNASTAPSILVPKLGHTIGSGVVSRGSGGFTSARQVLARDIFELRRVYGGQGIPNSSLQQLIQMNKTMYPGAFIK